MINNMTTISMRSCIQKVATGPEYSKDLSFDEARAAINTALSKEADPVQTAVLLIAMRMKRETDAEYLGVLQGIKDNMSVVTANVPQLADISDPYDGYARGLAITAFLPAVVAACGLPAFSHGVHQVGPKFGATHHLILKAAGIDVDLDQQHVAAKLEDPNIGWSYIDQKNFCPALHQLVSLRERMVKRQILTTVESLCSPIRGKDKTHVMCGYVHKAYPSIYASLARKAGFDSAVFVRGVEGGLVPSLKQESRFWFYKEGQKEQVQEIDPQELGITQATRATPLPDINADFDLDTAVTAAAELGLKTLGGKSGPGRDSLVYSASLLLSTTGHYSSRTMAATAVRQVLDSGEALQRFQAHG